MSPMEQLAKQEYERGYSDGKSDFFAAGVAEGEMRARQRMIANRVAANQHPFAAHGKPITEPVKQEQVGYAAQSVIDWLVSDERTDAAYSGINLYKNPTGNSTIPLYAAQVSAKREWVDLTDYEIVRLYDESLMCNSEMIAFARAVIAVFKEKNK